MHNFSGVVVDITGFHNIIKLFTAKCGTIIRKVQSIIQLVVCELGEILFAHDWKALVRYVRQSFWVREDKDAWVWTRRVLSESCRNVRN